MQPEMGVKVSKIVNLADDIKLNLAAEDIRIEAPIPGKAAVGIEVPNKEVVMVPFRDMMESKEFKESKSKIGFAAGRDIGGNVILSDIAKMPHLLIAGATGSGKSVCINTIIMSILFKAKPDEVKFVMIDPKVVELSVYNGIPHLLIPVVTDPKKAAGALNWAVREMDERYKKFANTGVRDMKGYNARIHNGMMTVDDHGQSVEIAAEKMPQIVVIVDELADLMMTAPKDVEGAICRLAQLARAAGIHLIIATQRPSVNVITGLIKANMPSRIAFSVTSGIDSRTILDMNGAEKLLGKGDMLYYPQGFTKPVRVQGAFVPDDDVINVVDFIKRENGGAAEYDMSIQDTIDSDDSSATAIDGGEGGFDSERDSYFADAGRLVIDKEKGSIGMLQRNFKVGFNRAARIMDQLEEFGVVGPEEGTKPRRVLLTKEQFEELLSQ
jgi:S-DNA-T family DNA segregation ATPase FtsK/SpoIIIE